MTNNLGELNLVKALLWIVASCALAGLVYSRFSFEQQPPPDWKAAEKTAVLERELEQTKNEAAALRKRIEEIEQRLSETKAPVAKQANPQPKAGKEK